MTTTRDHPQDSINKEVADIILNSKEPPVARFRMLSKGMEPCHRLFIKDTDSDVTGDKGCLACGNCVDSCPVLRKSVTLVS